MNEVTYTYNGRTVTKEELDVLVPRKPDWLEAPPMTADTYTEHDPLISDGTGCMKSQVGELREEIRKRGIVGAQVLDNGQVRYTSRRARREVLRAQGLVDNDGSYGD